MTDDYTPSLNEVCADYVAIHTRNFDSYGTGRSLTSEQEVYASRFDRWLASHDADVAERIDSEGEWTAEQWEEWSNELASLLPPHVDGDEAQIEIVTAWVQRVALPHTLLHEGDADEIVAAREDLIERWAEEAAEYAEENPTPPIAAEGEQIVYFADDVRNGRGGCGRTAPEGWDVAEWHQSAMADTGTSHTLPGRCYVVACEWCEAVFIANSKVRAMEMFREHEGRMLATPPVAATDEGDGRG